jgi:uncharacterized protein (TIGR02996 family)
MFSLEVSVHAGGKTTTQRFTSERGPVLIGSAAHCIVRVLGIAPVSARIVALEDAFEITVDGKPVRLVDGLTRLEIEHVLVDLTQRRSARATASAPAMLHSTEQQLRDEIWKQPTDPHLLAVYADWLATQGDDSRAEFIQLSLVPSPTRPQAKRLVALRNKYRGAWLGAARPFIYAWEEDTSSPGFVRTCQCEMAKLTSGFEHVRRLGPRLVVEVTAPNAKRETEALAKLPLGTLWGLAFYEADTPWITDELMATLAPAMHGLRELVLHAEPARASDRGWGAILEHIGSVEHLDLTLGANPDRWFELLLEQRRPPFKTLSLPGWIGKPMRKRLATIADEVQYRADET